MTEEQRIKNVENKRKRILTEEQRLRKAEYKRRRWAEMSDEQRMKIADYKRKLTADMTEEQRMLKQERIRQRRAEMTEEQKRKKAESERIRRTKMTEEQRIKRAEYKRKRRAHMTEEQRRKVIEYKRKVRAAMTEEQRMKKSENDRKRRAEMTEEQRRYRKEYHRQWRANMSEEQRLRHAEGDRRRAAKKMADRQMRRAQNIDNVKKKRRRRTKIEKIKIKTEKPVKKEKKILIEKQQIVEVEHERKGNSKITKEECQLLRKSNFNTLNNLILRMIDSKMNVEILTEIPKDWFGEILELLGIDSLNLTMNQNSAIQRLNYEIDICYLIDLLRRWIIWDGFKSFSIDESYDALLFYLKCNFIDFKLQIDNFILDEVNNFVPLENHISVSCSMRQLQSLFYHNPKNYKKIHYISNYTNQSRALFQKHVIWPYVSTQISFPNFSMIRKNDHYCKYKLLNIANKLKIKSGKRIRTNLFIKKDRINDNESVAHSKNDIAEFIRQFKNILSDCKANDLSTETCDELLTALTMFDDDVARCPDCIESNFKYQRCLSPYPYARYLGCPDDGGIYISMADQKAVKKSVLNVRLQQILHPKIIFILENFNMSYNNANDGKFFIFDETFLNNVNDCISYKCLLCDEYLGSCSSSRAISDHFFNHHGLEPDWECIKCHQSYTDHNLLNNGWYHDCK